MPASYHDDLYPTDDIPERHVQAMLRWHHSGKSARQIGKKMFASFRATYSDEHVRAIIHARDGS